jgi:hypothetical protein
MDAKIKALTLFRMFYSQVSGRKLGSIWVYSKEDSHVKTAKQCAIIACDEVLACLNSPPIKTEHMLWKATNAYWQDVLTELNKL